MKQRRKEPREERRQDQVEVNLLVEDEGSPRARRGCALPFLGVGLLVSVFEALRIGLA